jgi:uncharacterized coiled-coil protein SlyX
MTRRLKNLRIDGLEAELDRADCDMAALTELFHELVHHRRPRRKRHRDLLLALIERLRDCASQNGDVPPQPVPHGPPPIGDEPAFSMLALLGYRTGRLAPGDSERRRILDAVMMGPLPFLHSTEYTRAWGEPASPRRLYRMSKTIATRVRAMKGRRDAAELQLAIQQREADLQYLRHRYYTKSLQQHFKWPQT